MYPKHENEGDLSFDTKEKMEIYHMPSIICLRLRRNCFIVDRKVLLALRNCFIVDNCSRGLTTFPRGYDEKQSYLIHKIMNIEIHQ